MFSKNTDWEPENQSICWATPFPQDVSNYYWTILANELSIKNGNVLVQIKKNLLEIVLLCM